MAQHAANLRELPPLAASADAALPEPVAAANKRSPNRKPRIRRAFNMWEVPQLRAAFLKMFRATGDVTKAVEFVGRHPSIVSRWSKEDKGFKRAYEDLKADWDWLHSEALDNLESKSIVVLEQLLDQTGNSRLRFEVAKAILKRRGLLEAVCAIRR